MFTRSRVLCLLAVATFWFAAHSSALSADAKNQASKPKSQLKFEVYQDSANEYRWRLVSGEGSDRQVLSTGGQGYKAKADCMHGVKAIQEGADKLNFEIYDDNAKQSRWRRKPPMAKSWRHVLRRTKRRQIATPP